MISNLRWLVLMPGALAVSEGLPWARLALLGGFIAAYAVMVSYCVADALRFMKYGRKISVISRGFDIVAVTAAATLAGRDGSLSYLLYWFVLVSFGFTSGRMISLIAAGAAVLVANAAMTLYTLSGLNTGNLILNLGVRSGVLILGILISVYIAKTRTQDDLASERGSHLHAILDCGARLTSLRSVHELALYVLESSVKETGAGGGELLLANEETGSFECEAFYTADNEGRIADSPPEPLLLSYANWVKSSGREFVVRTGGKASEDSSDQDNHPAAAVPLLWQASNADTGNSTLGVLVVWGYKNEDFGEDALDILRIFAAIAGAAIVNLRLYTNLQKSFLRTLQSLANGLEARDEYTRGHSERVMQVACMVANELCVPNENIDSLRNASLLHDIGKIGVPDDILRKAGKLSAEEWETMRRHPDVSEEICRPLGLPQEVLFLIRHHHERLDGKGYPAGLPPREQPLLQRILVVADSFDAMRSRRPYRDVMPKEELIGELNRSAGRTLDPTVVDALRKLMERGDLDSIYEEHDRIIEATIRYQKREAA